MEQALRGIDPRAIPSQQRPHGEAVTKVMEVRRGGARGDGESEGREQPAEHAPDLLTSEPPAADEERRVGREVPVACVARGQIALERRAEARPEGHKAILAELRVTDDEQLARPEAALGAQMSDRLLPNSGALRAR